VIEEESLTKIVLILLAAAKFHDSPAF
jgi:hypothetical protein